MGIGRGYFPWKTDASHVKFHRGSVSFTGYPVKPTPAKGGVK